MTKPNSFILENEIVYEAEKLYEFDTVYFYGCSRIRTIIDRKKLNDEDYIFGYIKDNKWIKSTKTYQKAKLLIKEDWVLNNVPKLMNEIIEINNNYEEAPEILELDSNEKFKDEQGNIIEIEVRGERNYNKCYFKVKDISKEFEMPNLNTAILDKNTIYFKDIHYKNFIIKKINNTSKKYLFFTSKGFMKCIYTSKNNKFNIINNYIIKKWLDGFDSIIFNKYELNIDDIKKSTKNGYIYIVTSELLTFVKIGMWRSTISSLYSRYITYYGNNIDIKYFYVNNVRKIEYNVHKYFEHRRISNELFDKNYYNDYIAFINTINS